MKIFLLPLIAIALPWLHCTQGRRGTGDRWHAILSDAIVIFGVALLLVLPWLARNMYVYGLNDPLAWKRHDEIVVGQLTTRELWSRVGTKALSLAFLRTTYQSFWAQFGWMGVLVDRRIYLALAWLSGIAGFGSLLSLTRMHKEREKLERWQRGAILLSVLWVCLTFGTYLWYNTKFVQHQGRYLFPALIPIGLFFALGLLELLSGRYDRVMVILFGIGLALALAIGLLTGNLSKISLLFATVGLVFFLIRSYFTRLPAHAFTIPIYGGLAALDAICLWGFIVPYLGG